VSFSTCTGSIGGRRHRPAGAAAVDDGRQQEVGVEAEDAVVLQALFDAVDQLGGNRLAGDVVARKTGQQFAVAQPAFVDERRQFDEVPGHMLAAQ
jgi:hypothetical protein